MSIPHNFRIGYTSGEPQDIKVDETESKMIEEEHRIGEYNDPMLKAYADFLRCSYSVWQAQLPNSRKLIRDAFRAGWNANDWNVSVR